MLLVGSFDNHSRRKRKDYLCFSKLWLIFGKVDDVQMLRRKMDAVCYSDRIEEYFDGCLQW